MKKARYYKTRIERAERAARLPKEAQAYYHSRPDAHLLKRDILVAFAERRLVLVS